MLGAEPVWALGTMSGTSLDGVDAALVRTDGERIVAFGEAAYRPYTEAERAVIRAALGRWPGEAGVAEAAEVVETAHAALMAPLAARAELAGFHGQTLAHDPGGGRTHQAGDGQVLAEVLGLPVVWDFRSADVRLGGQGAPLAPFFHFACARWIGAEAPLAFLNLGGVGNLTWVDPRAPAPETPGACIAFDTGPANAPVNDLVRARRGRDCDEGGALAATGDPDDAIVARFLRHPYFFRMPPKSLDRDDFAFLLDDVAGLSDADAAATLTAAAAAAVAQGAQHFPAPVARLLVTGGGRHNATLMAMIAALLDCPVQPVEAAGLDGDMLEAQAFAHLAVRVVRGLPTSCPGTTGVGAAVGGGRVSRPNRG
ncbi:MAG: anhydro-N-acetylmuramic acid kinase [Rhodobacteraceae bacterium]|jgi:anhydro-N-acetylmuramic acid kinase|uniref:anhydro-N-acetylmuramic acid kinase n=1 Tax=Albidovulum sp. TaxID=1872424 RepID=UPI001D99F5F4|nr:anhydro-N-acetylmuramic acid kinase [uncultured Defluviimonas sp.]MCB2125169.1 anhydro-N-acetylmuramic acid kinase [Paracoccaceae bacterium]MCC0070359.1 anhydro-N-acetylmuramic acid kinase [Paracoccaceae bacterium]